MKPDYAAAAKMIAGAEHIGVLTGAGISTLSGIADFRGNSETSFYRDPSKMKVFDIDEFDSDPSFFYTVIRPMMDTIFAARPSVVHNLLARLEAIGKVKTVATQNIDVLHQKAGSRSVVELHGSFATSTCRTCRRCFTLAALREMMAAATVPRCPCGGVVKPDVTFFGEMLPEGALAAAEADAARSDLYLVLGTSLAVSPANMVPRAALANGAKIIIVNAQPTYLDDAATLLLPDLQEFGEAVNRGIVES